MRIFHLAGAVAALAMLAACGDEPGQANAQQQAPPPPQVGIITLAPQRVPLDTELAGRTSAFQVSEVRPQVSGIIKARLFAEGSDVQAGQPLYQIDDATYRAAFEQAKAQAAATQANIESLRLRAERYAGLVRVNGVSRQEADDAKAAYQQAQAAVAADRAALQAAQINLNYTTLAAPISGRIGRSSVTAGALVTASQATALATIMQLDPIYVDITQSSQEILALKRQFASGGSAPVDAPVSLRLEDGTEYALKGKLEFTEVGVDAATGTVTLRAQFPNPDGLLLPGMFVRAVLTQSVQDDAILAPQQGVARNNKGEATAMVLTADNTVESRILVTPRTVGTSWLVTDGLKAGDRLIVDGLQKIRPGAKAVPVEADLAAIANNPRIVQ
ncbi:efflux RND transporter periplasmic adaptor subunit [Zavarzinia sp. CC-PAN008]|uniref:efflux RND transporter periplasmic adaptor subunit n=1 Tax=Zavarzinia sp. CC-PAN008 TaxID=3243332 RepID=UPI003F749E89